MKGARGRPLVAFVFVACVSAACAHTRSVDTDEPARTEASAGRPERAPSRKALAGDSVETANGISLTTAPAGLLKPGAATLLQERLSRVGLLSADQATGNLNAATRDALRRFQSTHDLPATGEPDGATVQKLGLKGDDVFKSSHDTSAAAGSRAP